MTKKVSFVITDMSSGGAERVMSLIANYFVSNDIEVDILAIKSQKIDYSIDKRINYKFLGEFSNPIKKVLVRLKKIRHEVKDSDAVISFLWHCNVYTILATMFMKKKIIISERSNPATEMRGKFKFFKWFRNLCYHFADIIVFQTDDAKEYYKGSLNKKGVVIPNPLSLNLPNIESKRNNKIVAVGRLTEQKNYYLMLNAYKNVYKTIGNYQLLIYGVGELENDLKKWILDNELSNYVTLKGFSNNVISEISDSKLFLNSSNFEGISNSMLEALSMGIPVIATDCPVGGAKQFIKNDENGYLVEMENENQFSKAIIEALTNEEKWKTMSENASEIRNKLSIEKIGKKWLNIIKE